MKLVRIAILLLFSQIGVADDSLPGNSIYQVDGEWQNQDKHYMELSNLIGKRQVVTMIYTHCEHVCPVIVSSMKSVESALPEQNLDETGFVLISFTPDSDTPEVMKAYAEKHNLDPNRWTLLRGNEEQVRTVAMTLGVKYELLPDNEVNHSNLITVLDSQGRMEFQGSGALSEAHNVTEHILNN